MKSTFQVLVEDWVSNSLPHIHFPEPLTIHINSLLNRQLEEAEVVPIACQTYHALVNVMLEMSDMYMASLVIPLTCVDDPIGDIPTDAYFITPY